MELFLKGIAGIESLSWKCDAWWRILNEDKIIPNEIAHDDIKCTFLIEWHLNHCIHKLVCLQGLQMPMFYYLCQVYCTGNNLAHV